MTTIPTQRESKRRVGPPLLAGRKYRYTSELPRGRKGELYHLHGSVLDVPSQQQKVLVECLTGPDAGLLFVCSEMNFALRYELEPGPEGQTAVIEQAEPVTANITDPGKGW